MAAGKFRRWLRKITPAQWRSVLRLAGSLIVSVLSMVLVDKLNPTAWAIELGGHRIVLSYVAIAAIALGEVVFALLDREVRRWLRLVTIDQWRAIDRETERSLGEAGSTSVQVLIILVTVAIALTLQEYLGGHDEYRGWFPNDSSRYWDLWGYAWWSGWRVFGYVVLPVIVLALLPGVRVADFHVSLRGLARHLWIYLVMFCCVLPLVVLASKTQAFRETYPFYRKANRSWFDLGAWEVLYTAQFVSLEFFFRGFLLQGLRRALGANAIFVMIVPYCMIHYGKPLPETIGAIIAGLILGTLAMRTRSIWGGVMIHVGVAITMDVLAIDGCPPIGSGKFCH